MIWVVVAFVMVGNSVSTLQWQTAHHLAAFEFETREQCEATAEMLRRDIKLVEVICLLKPAKL